jgi:heterodisulfide reductase subunit A-like polyferredoxin
MSNKKVIVIGAGIGGITTAIHLAKKGLSATVFEKNARPGGRCDRISQVISDRITVIQVIITCISPVQALVHVRVCRLPWFQAACQRNEYWMI